MLIDFGISANKARGKGCQGEENCFLFGPLDRKELDLREESVGGQLVMSGFNSILSRLISKLVK